MPVCFSAMSGSTIGDHAQDKRVAGTEAQVWKINGFWKTINGNQMSSGGKREGAGRRKGSQTRPRRDGLRKSRLVE
jgi:hypothetical protein